MEAPQDQSVILMGSEEMVSFTCQARAVPPADIMWSYTRANGPPVTNFTTYPRIAIQTEVNTDTYTTTSTLTISQVEFADRGSLACTAANDFTPPSTPSASASLTVYGE